MPILSSLPEGSTLSAVPAPQLGGYPFKPSGSNYLHQPSNPMGFLTIHILDFGITQCGLHPTLEHLSILEVNLTQRYMSHTCIHV